VDDSGGERAREAERISDGDYKLARPRRRVPEFRREQSARRHLQLRQIALVISRLDFRWKGLPVPKINQMRSLSEDVSIRNERSCAVPDHSGTRALLSRVRTADVNRRTAQQFADFPYSHLSFSLAARPW
jgi:hypothetical protein